ncbi:MAG: aldo/keto reductase, partial [Anaerolineae bacterium]|nr:aldo/keto reductase [Anaerolineae bacterium]
FNEDSKRAVTPGVLFEGFGGARRKAVLKAAFDHGINFLDATIDSEKEALGRNLQEVAPPFEVYVQTRPEGMVYTYDPFNAKMARYDLLRAEVARSLDLLQRDRLDFLNIAPMATALEHDPAYLDKIAENVRRLKSEGLIHFACADTFSGEAMYLREIETGAFDAIYINFNFANDGGRRAVLPAAAERGLAVFTREAFMKGALFKMGEEVGVTNRDRLARLALKWILSAPEVTLVMVGADTADQLARNIAVLEDPALNDEDMALLARIRTATLYQAYAAQRAADWTAHPLT